MKARLQFLSLLPFLLVSCKAQVQLQFENRSRENFKKVNVGVLGKKFSFDALMAGASTGFVKVDSTYSYCYVQVITNTDTLSSMPVDYMGEKLYKSGKLKMSLVIDDKRRLIVEGKR